MDVRLIGGYIDLVGLENASATDTFMGILVTAVWLLMVAVGESGGVKQTQ